MPIQTDKKRKIIDLLKLSIMNKFNAYKPESINMPFHYRLLGRDRMALYSFIQSLNTTFGTSIYEPVAKELARDKFKEVFLQVKPSSKISSEAQITIQNIVDRISTGELDPDKRRELEEIRKVCCVGEIKKVKLTRVDIWLEDYSGNHTLIDMKTVKPNIGDFKAFKRMLLEWAAAEMARNPSISIETLIGIPYNPYEPKPYERWTLKGIFDLDNELKVADELWDFFGGPGTYYDLLDCFEIAGIELRPEIDNFFLNFK